MCYKSNRLTKRNPSLGRISRWEFCAFPKRRTLTVHIEHSYAISYTREWMEVNAEHTHAIYAKVMFMQKCFTINNTIGNHLAPTVFPELVP